jgi:hypothetical protein
MKRLFLSSAMAAALAFAGTALAEQYKWVDKDGRVRYGDTPPAGVKATPLTPAPRPGAPAPASQGEAKAAPAAPLTPAEQEAAFRKRQIDAQKQREKQDQASQNAAARRENCARAQEALRAAQSGQRMARTDAKGERYYLDEGQLAQEAASAQQAANEWCVSRF